jgi:hypothetical protein
MLARDAVWRMDAMNGIPTVHYRHLQVHNNKVEGVSLKGGNGLFTIAGLMYLVSGYGKAQGDYGACVGVIVNEKKFHPGALCVCRSWAEVLT